jgi:hypothetical protein
MIGIGVADGSGSPDGNKGYPAAGDIVDGKNHTIIAGLKDEFGHAMHSQRGWNWRFRTES